MILPPGLEKISFGFRRCQTIHARMSDDGDPRITSEYDYPDIILQGVRGFVVHKKSPLEYLYRCYFQRNIYTDAKKYNVAKHALCYGP